MDSRKEKIGMLSRINRGRALSSGFLRELSGILGETLTSETLRPLSETDQISEIFREGYRMAVAGVAIHYRKFFCADQSGLVMSLADCLADRMAEEHLFLLTKPGRDCGAVRVKGRVLIAHVASVIRFDGDSLSALSDDHTQGILIDRNPDDPIQTYEVTVWGKRWLHLIKGCV